MKYNNMVIELKTLLTPVKEYLQCHTEEMIYSMNHYDSLHFSNLAGTQLVGEKNFLDVIRMIE